MKKKIVILGAGFAGLRVAKLLSKKLLSRPDCEIVLVDKRNFHLYTPDLYEVATAFNEKITDECLLRLKETVAVPLNELVDKKNVKFVFDRVLDIDVKKKELQLKKGEALSYDYLVVAMGSETNFFGIKGMYEHCYPLKTVGQALAINCELDQYFHDLWNKQESKKPVHISICGGGATGIETAAELVCACNKICGKYQYDRSAVTIQLIEGGQELAHFGKEGTLKLRARLRKLGVKLYLGSYVQSASKKSLKIKTTDSKLETIPSDMTIWTGGVKVNSVVEKSIGNKERRGAIVVNNYLQSDFDEKVFAIGDNAFIESDGRPVPWLAQMAVKEADVVVKNILALVEGRKMKVFKASMNIPVIIPVGGKYAFIKWGRVVLGGYWAYFLRRFVDFRYYLSILPFKKACCKWWRGEKIFEANN